MKSENLVVRLHGEVIGFLEPFKNGARFRFAESLSSVHPDSPLLSTALPVSSNPFPSDATRNWFVGLLPEDARAEEISRFLGVDANDYLSLAVYCEKQIGMSPLACAAENEDLSYPDVPNALQPAPARKERKGLRFFEK